MPAGAARGHPPDRAAAAADGIRVGADGPRAGGAPTQATGLIAIVTRRPSLFHGLAAACRIAGYSVVWKTFPTRRNVEGAVALLWEGATMDDGELERLRQIGTLAPRMPIIALLGFPRYDMVLRAQRCGVRAVLALPCLLPDLWSTLREVTRKTPDG